MSSRNPLQSLVPELTSKVASGTVAAVAAATTPAAVIRALTTAPGRALLRDSYEHVIRRCSQFDPHAHHVLWWAQRTGMDRSFLSWLKRPEVRDLLSARDRKVQFASLVAALAEVLRIDLVQALRTSAREKVEETSGRPPSDPAALAAWAEAFGVTAWLALPGDVATGGRLLEDDSTRYLDQHGRRPVGELLTEEVEDGNRRAVGAKIPYELRQALADVLIEGAADRLLADEDDQDRPPIELPSARRPRLRAAASELLELYVEEVARIGAPWHLDVPLSAGLRVVEDPPAVLWAPAGARFPSVRVELSPPSVDGGIVAWQGQRSDPVRQRALASALRWIVKGAPADVLDLLEGELAVPPWQRFLDDLEPLLAGPELLGFELRQDTEGWWLAVLECTEGGGGQVSSRTLALNKVDRATPRSFADGAALAALMGMTGASDLRPADWRRLQHEPDRISRALSVLRGHPRLYLKHPQRRELRVRTAVLGLRVRPLDGQIELVPTLDGRPATPTQLTEIASQGDSVVLVDADAGVVRLLTVRGRSHALLNLLSERGGRFEAEAAEPLLAFVGGIEEIVPVSLDRELAGLAVEPDPRLVVRLELADGLLGVSLWSRPLPEGRLLTPGEGSDAAYAVRADERVHAARDLAAERTAAMHVADELRLEDAEHDGAYAWWVEDADLAGTAIATLKARDDIVTEWVGRRGRLRAAPGLSRLAIRFKSLGGWFGVEGTLDMGSGAEVDLAALLEAAAQGRAFVAVGEGEWLQLSDELRDALAPLSAAIRAGGEDHRLALVHAGALDALREGGAVLEGPAEWLTVLDRVDAAATWLPELPETLTATLRHYQLDGFHWATRLASWAGGAVLADDMGLGKTVQALAILLDRQAEGPALVVAPASVVFNWQREAERFAPSLEVQEHRGRDRAERLAEVGAGDVVLTTWTLLARDAATLAAVTWGTVVFDEAQAMKNLGTRRSKAARGLRTGFALAMTGTPVENHAGELHALMAVVLPGLLGSASSFRDKFARPIADGDEAARTALAALVSPFVLRRLKTKVAKELPPKTEVTLAIELAPAERAVYERVRKAGLAELQLAAAQADNKRRFAALGLLTRLRQAACHPKLIVPDSTVPSSKTRQAVELLTELRAEGHAALVFSQFVGHLKLVRGALEEEGFRLAYLDGSTPAARRRDEVDRFQAGDADVFLISLKAGGTGLNLTAATYVLHLDPWWNPAVEDQATDRTHRIGQDRPVTIYRLLARDTVEETIVQMHADKRELADQLLAGAASSKALSADELTKLIVGAGVTP